MDKLIIVSICLSMWQISYSQTENLTVEGAINISNSATVNPEEGTIRWTGQDFEGYDGTNWLSLTEIGIGNLLHYKNKAEVQSIPNPAQATSLFITSEDGGIFNYVTSSSYTDTGTAFCGLFISDGSASGGWERQDIGKPYYEWWGATGDASDDQTVAMHQAFASGVNALWGKAGAEYAFDPVPADGFSPTISEINSDGTSIWHIKANANHPIGFEISPRQFFTFKNIWVYGQGTTTDGHYTTGLHFDRQALLLVENVRMRHFSGEFLVITQCVKAKLKDIAMNLPSGVGVGIHLKKSATNIPCTTVVIDQPYLIGGLNAIRGSCVLLDLRSPILEYSGSDTAEEGALHLTGGTVTITSPYWEGCKRNWVTRETSITWLGQTFAFENPAAAPNIVSYVGTAFANRGAAKLNHNLLSVREVGPDKLAGKDLNIGALNVPVDPTKPSTFYGNHQLVYQTTVTSGVWSTVATVPRLGGPDLRFVNMHDYLLVVGNATNAQASTGRIFNRVIHPDGGAEVSAWLRTVGNAIQVKVAGTGTQLDAYLKLNVMASVK